MPYNVRIKNENGDYLRGYVYYYDAAGNEIGQTVVYPAGTDLDIELVNEAAYFRVTADGYQWYGSNIENLGESNVVTVIKKPDVALYVAGGIVAGLLAYRLFFKR